MRMAHTSAARAVLFALTLAVACDAVWADAPASVQIENFTFKPATLSVRVGATVTFTNGDDIPHSIVAKDGSYHSKALDTGDAFTVTFETTGDYGYFCGLHPHMTGHVVVTP